MIEILVHLAASTFVHFPQNITITKGKSNAVTTIAASAAVCGARIFDPARIYEANKKSQCHAGNLFLG